MLQLNNNIDEMAFLKYLMIFFFNQDTDKLTPTFLFEVY